MKTSNAFSVSAILVAAVLWLLAPLARADMVPTEDVAPANAAGTEREKVEAFLERASVQEKFKLLGVQDTLLKSRVDALTDEEIHLIAGRIDSLPAGGRLTYEEIIIILLVIILVAIIV